MVFLAPFCNSRFVLAFSLILASVSLSQRAAGDFGLDECKGPPSQGCFRGERVTFTNPIMNGFECGRGISFVDTYCASGSRAVSGRQECLIGQFLICAFCKDMSDDALASKIRINPKDFRDEEGCQSIYDMKRGQLKRLISEARFNKIVNDLLERIVVIQNKIEEIGALVKVETMTSEAQIIRRAEEMKILRNLIKGAGGLKEILDRLGASNTSTQTVELFDRIEKELFIPFETSSFSLSNKDDLEVWNQLKNKLVEAYGSAGTFIFENFSFRPEPR